MDASNQRKSSDEPLMAKNTAPAPKKGTASELREARRFQRPQLWGKSSGVLDLDDGSKLRDMLLSPAAWNCLDAAAQQAILAKLPQSYRLNGAPDIDALANDDNFRNDCAHYYENMREGRLTDAWLTKAWKAHYKDQHGDFKKPLQHAFEDKFMEDASGQTEEANKGDDDKTEAEAGKQDEDKMDLDEKPASADDDKAKDTASKNGSPKPSD